MLLAYIISCTIDCEVLSFFFYDDRAASPHLCVSPSLCMSTIPYAHLTLRKQSQRLGAEGPRSTNLPLFVQAGDWSGRVGMCQGDTEVNSQEWAKNQGALTRSRGSLPQTVCECALVTIIKPGYLDLGIAYSIWF